MLFLFFVAVVVKKLARIKLRRTHLVYNMVVGKITLWKWLCSAKNWFEANGGVYVRVEVLGWSDMIRLFYVAATFCYGFGLKKTGHSNFVHNKSGWKSIYRNGLAAKFQALPSYRIVSFFLRWHFCLFALFFFCFSSVLNHFFMLSA